MDRLLRVLGDFRGSSKGSRLSENDYHARFSLVAENAIMPISNCDLRKGALTTTAFCIFFGFLICRIRLDFTKDEVYLRMLWGPIMFGIVYVVIVWSLIKLGFNLDRRLGQLSAEESIAIALVLSFMVFSVLSSNL